MHPVISPPPPPPQPLLKTPALPRIQSNEASCILVSSERVLLPRVMGYCRISKVSVFKQKILLSGFLLRRKNRIMIVPWSSAAKICGISAAPSKAMRPKVGVAIASCTQPIESSSREGAEYTPITLVLPQTLSRYSYTRSLALTCRTDDRITTHAQYVLFLVYSPPYLETMVSSQLLY